MSGKKVKLWLTGMVLFVALMANLGPEIAAQEPNLANGDVIPGQYIVLLADNTNANLVADELAKAHNLILEHIYNHALRGFSAQIPDGRLENLRQDARVLAIEPNRFVSLDNPSLISVPDRPDQTTPTGILRINGHLSSTISGDGAGAVDVDVAVIDTGIDVHHPDLNVAGGYNCSFGLLPTPEGTRRPERLRRGYDDDNGHGTHVAGTIAALDNDFGVVGVAPGARLWAVRVLSRGGFGSTSRIICGIDWVTAHADVIEVANMSLGGPGSDDGLSCEETTDLQKKAICNSVAAGVTYVVAAGNNSSDAGGYVPAAYDMVTTVSALADFDGEPGGVGSSACPRNDGDDTLANFSNFGADVDIIAPGVCILSTWKDRGYLVLSGTSMASPHVAGAAALYMANNPDVTPIQVQGALQNAGNFDWDDNDDPDGIKEPLLEVSLF